MISCQREDTGKYAIVTLPRQVDTQRSLYGPSTLGNDHEFQDGGTRTWRALVEEYVRQEDTKSQDFVEMMSLLTVLWVRRLS